MARRFTDRAVFDGETLTGTFTAPDGTTAVTVKLADGAKTADVAATDNGDGTWDATATAETLAGFSGATRWIAYGGNRLRRGLHPPACLKIPGGRCGD